MESKVERFIRECSKGPRPGNALRQVAGMIKTAESPDSVQLLVATSRHHAKWYVEQFIERIGTTWSAHWVETGDGFTLTFPNGATIYVHLSHAAKMSDYSRP